LYRKNNHHQLEFDEFQLSFGGQLDSDNRWIKLSRLIPWKDLEEKYAILFCEDNGCEAIPFRCAFGALIIKARMDLDDRETVAMITENPYLQYFIGYRCFITQTPFHPSSMTHFRKRMSLELVNQIDDLIWEYNEKGKGGKRKLPKGKSLEENHGSLKIDATIAPADIRYPSDISLLNEAREKTEGIIDRLCRTLNLKKPRTYRRLARKAFLSIIKRKKGSKKKIQKAVKKQLGYLGRNIKNIVKIVGKAEFFPFEKKDLRIFWIVRELYRQQEWMYQNKTNRIDDRIVSIQQPHVRPMVRGKLGKEVEFGSKLSLSVSDGFCKVDRISWSSYNESKDLIGQVEKFRKRHGHYPSVVCADNIYGTRENRNYLRERGIRLTGKPLGRPVKNPTKSAYEKRRERQELRSRSEVEGKFGTGKRAYGLDRVYMRLCRTSEVWIGMTFLTMNLDKWLRVFLCLLNKALNTLIDKIFRQDLDRLLTGWTHLQSF